MRICCLEEVDLFLQTDFFALLGGECDNVVIVIHDKA
jgi:hypothetical protein